MNQLVPAFNKGNNKKDNKKTMKNGIKRKEKIKWKKNGCQLQNDYYTYDIYHMS